MKTLFTKYKFLTSLVRAASDTTKSSAKGYVLQICNLIRLVGDLDPPSGYLRTYLSNHDEWIKFLPTLMYYLKFSLIILTFIQ